jgi:hypothetical protein
MLTMRSHTRTHTPAWRRCTHTLQRRLGGGEGVEGIYGSITQKGTQRILTSLHHNCGLGPDSVLVDIGAGLGRPLLHAMHSHGIKGGFGIELDTVKVAKVVRALRANDGWACTPRARTHAAP